MAKTFAVLHTKKLKTTGEIGGLGKHNERARDTPNADPERTALNERLAGSGDWVVDVQDRLDTQERIRTNAVLAVSHLLSASRDWFEAASPAQVEAWRDRSMEWLRETYGAENVVAAVLHRDETTLHIQAMVVPIDERGKLTASHWLDGPAKMSALQDSYARAVEDLGLVRGVQGSVATHQELQEWYAKVQTPTPAAEIVKQHLEVERPGRIIGNPERWAIEQIERIAELITPALDAALVKVTHYEMHGRRAARVRVRVVEPLDHGREGVGPRHLAVQVDGIAAGILLNRARILVDGVGGQVLQLEPAGVQQRDAGAAAAVGGVRPFGVERVDARPCAAQRDQAAVEERGSHAFAALGEE